MRLPGSVSWTEACSATHPMGELYGKSENGKMRTRPLQLLCNARQQVLQSILSICPRHRRNFLQVRALAMRSRGLVRRSRASGPGILTCVQGAYPRATTYTISSMCEGKRPHNEITRSKAISALPPPEQFLLRCLKSTSYRSGSRPAINLIGIWAFPT